MEKRLLNLREACWYTSIGKTRFRLLAVKIGADRHFGRRVLYDRAAIDRYLDRLTPDIDGFDGIKKGGENDGR